MARFAKRFAASLLFIPLALLAIWLHLPWWLDSAAIGLYLFACYALWEGEPIPLKGAAAALSVAIALGVAASSFAASKGISWEELRQDQTLRKDIRRLPEYALSFLSFSLSAGVAALVRRRREQAPARNDDRA